MGIKVLCADDSKHIRNILSRLLSSHREIDEVLLAENGEEAVRLVHVYSPDVVLLDLKMPKVDGLEAMRSIKKFSEVPVIIMSSYTQPGAKATIEALELGAFDFLPKPVSGRPDHLLMMRDKLIILIEEAYKAYGSMTDRRTEEAEVRHEGAGIVSPISSEKPVPGLGSLSRSEVGSFNAIAIGCSTGGPYALGKMLPLLPESFPWPILIVQHMPSYFTSYFAKKLDEECLLKVKEAEDREFVEPGIIYIAPGDCHLSVKEAVGELRIDLDYSRTPVSGALPSVDILFDSVTKCCGSKAIGILLTGMGDDGVNGLLRMKEVNAVTIVQDSRSSFIYGMPGRALKLGASDNIVDLTDIPKFIYDEARRKALRRKITQVPRV